MRAERITSRKNPLLQQIRKLFTSRKEREEAGLFAGDGTKLLEEAIRWCPDLHTVILSEGLNIPAMPEHVSVYQVPGDVMESLSPMKAPQGAIFLCRIPDPESGSLTPGSLILEGIQDPGNLGTILRTADAFDVPVVLADGCADVYNWKTVRASMGAVFRTKPVQISTREIIQQCKLTGIPLATTALSSESRDIRSVDLSKTAVVIGNEGQGVSRQFLDHCDMKLIIPMNPHCESLNAAVAASVAMWEMYNHRQSPI